VLLTKYTDRKRETGGGRRPERKIEPLSSKNVIEGRKRRGELPGPKDPIYLNKTRWWCYNVRMR